MSDTGLDTFDRTIQTTNLWLREIAEHLGTSDRRRAWHALGAVLQVLRDRLPVDEAAQLAAQLPLLVRGLYYEGWDPGRPKRIQTREEFVRHVRDVLGGQAAVDAPDACAAVFATLRGHVTKGELSDIESLLPTDLKGWVKTPV